MFLCNFFVKPIFESFEHQPNTETYVHSKRYVTSIIWVCEVDINHVIYFYIALILEFWIITIYYIIIVTRKLFIFIIQQINNFRGLYSIPIELCACLHLWLAKVGIKICISEIWKEKKKQKWAVLVQTPRE